MLIIAGYCRLDSPEAKIEVVEVDLASLASVRKLAQQLLDGGKPLDVLINNAGWCYFVPVHTCPYHRVLFV